VSEAGTGESGRREQVLATALATFARYGYRKTSMDDVARAADISRPGLYFLFTSKQNLFRAAVTQALDADLEAAKRSLEDAGRPLRDRLIEAFDSWSGRYVGPMAKEVTILMDANPDLLGPLTTDYPKRFAEMVTDALTTEAVAGGIGALTTEAVAGGFGARATEGPASTGAAADVAHTLLSTAAGIKHDAASRDEFITRLTVAVDLLLSALRAR
jgi:AcrR family transcriptional regulator